MRAGWAVLVVLLTASPAVADVVVAFLDPAVDLAGTWKFRVGDDPAWAQPGLPDGDWARIEVPRPWGKQGFRGYSGVAWYRLRVRLPPEALIAPRPRLGLSLGFVDSSYEAYAGGILLGGVGALPPHQRMEYDRTRTYSVPSEAVGPDGMLVLALRVWKSPIKDGNLGGPYHGAFLIGRLEDLARREVIVEVPSLVLSFMFVVVGLYHVQLYRRRPELTEYLWFGSTAAVSGLYTFLRSQWKYFVSQDFLLLKELEYLGLFITPAVIVQFLWPLLGRRIGRALRVYQWINVALAAAVALEPGLRLNVALLPPWSTAVLGFAVLTSYVVLREALGGNPEARTISIGLVMALGAIVNDIAVDRAWFQGPRLIPYGFAAFVLSMAVSLANRFSRVYREVQELGVALEQRVQGRTRELQAANTALAEASAAKSQFVANMSHELRTPLNAVIGYSEMLEELAREEGVDQFIPDLLKIRSAGAHLLRVINDILDLSKVEAGKMELTLEPVALPPLVQDVLATVRPQAVKNANVLEVKSAQAPVNVRADAVRLKQVLLNLLSNGCKFTANGRVTLEIGTESEDGHGWAVFRVSDTGIGMTPEQLGRLFQPFAQADPAVSRKYGGTGLGLALSRQFCEAMHGSVTAASTLGAGSVFTVRLPLA